MRPAEAISPAVIRGGRTFRCWSGRMKANNRMAPKVQRPTGDGPNDAGLSRHHIIRSAEVSLRRLGTDYIDLYQVHERDGQTPLKET